MWCTGLVALQHVGSSRTRAQTRVPCTGRWILNHCATRETQSYIISHPYYYYYTTPTPTPPPTPPPPPTTTITTTTTSDGDSVFAVHLIVHLVSVSPSAARPSDVLLMATNMHLRPLIENSTPGASLVVQWLGIHLPMQGTRVLSLVREDPTCHGATKLVRHNY